MPVDEHGEYRRDMSNPFGKVSALLVVIPAGVALFVILVRRLRARRALTAPRASVVAALSVYAAGVVANTVFPIFLNPRAATSRGCRPSR